MHRVCTSLDLANGVLSAFTVGGGKDNKDMLERDSIINSMELAEQICMLSYLYAIDNLRKEAREGAFTEDGPQTGEAICLTQNS